MNKRYLVTYIAIAMLAYVSVCVTHEVLGHSVMCLAEHGDITMLTSVYFHCKNGGILTDLAGPMANLVMGLICLSALRMTSVPANTRLFLIFAATFHFLWLAGCLLVSAIANQSDFAYPLQALPIVPIWLGRLGLGILGVVIYIFTIRRLGQSALPGPLLRSAYFATGLLSCGAALFFAGNVPHAVRDAALESFVMSAGLLVLGRQKHQDPAPANFGQVSPGWELASAIGIIGFVATLGKGLVVAGGG